MRSVKVVPEQARRIIAYPPINRRNGVRWFLGVRTAKIVKPNAETTRSHLEKSDAGRCNRRDARNGSFRPAKNYLTNGKAKSAATWKADMCSRWRGFLLETPSDDETPCQR